MISTILVPSIASEIADISRLFFSWHSCYRLGSLCATNFPISTGFKPKLLVTFPSSHDGKLALKLNNLFEIHCLHEIFSDIKISFLGLNSDENIYLREIPFRSRFPLLKKLNPLPKFGTKSGPNLQFFESILLCDTKGYTLLNETDMIPIVPNWINVCSDALPVNFDFLIAGAAYLGKGNLSSKIALHLNGNAIYNTASQYFMESYIPLWQQSLAHMCSFIRDAAYDTWLDLAISHTSECRNSSNKCNLWLRNQPPLEQLIFFKSKMVFLQEICNFSLPTDEISFEQIAYFREQYSPKTLIHSRPSIPHLLSFLLLQSRDIVASSSLDELAASVDGLKNFECVSSIL